MQHSLLRTQNNIWVATTDYTAIDTFFSQYTFLLAEEEALPESCIHTLDCMRFMIDVGLDESFVTGILSMGVLILTCGKFLTGACYDRFGLRISMPVCDVLAVLAMLTLAITVPSSAGMTYALIHCICSPLTLPLETVMLSLITNDTFGDASFNKVPGIVTAVNYVGFAVCSSLVNLCYDIFGTYVPVLYAFVIMMAAVAVIFQFSITAAHKDRPAVVVQ